MRINLQNKLALITGGGVGLGKLITLTLAKTGADVVICGRKEKSLEKTQQEVEELGVKSYIYRLDGTKSLEVKKLFSTLIAKIGKLDILVNNIGGVEKFGSFFDLEEKDWKKAYELNCLSMVYFCCNAIPWLRKSSHARIINIATVSARQPGAFIPHYSAAKTAMLNISKHLANLLAKDSILVNAICPGTLNGGSWEKNIKDRAKRLNISFDKAQKEMEAEEKGKVPLGKIGTLADVASLVAYLSSDKAGFITGTSIDVDGGVVRSIF